MIAATKRSVKEVYRKYTGNLWGAGDRKFYQSIETLDTVVIETAVILYALKGEGACAENNT